MKAAIFDLDGTLIDSMWLWENLADNYLLSIGIDPPANLSKSLREFTLEQASAYLKERFNLGGTAEDISENIEKILLEYYKGRFELKPYVPELLQELKKRNTRMALATATDEHLASVVLKRHGIDRYFEFIQTHQNTGLHKGQVEFFQIAIKRLGLDPNDIWLFEDALYSMKTAKRCGLNVVAIRDESALPDLERIKKVADIYIEHFRQLEVEKL